jgi:hypothetical protein
MAAGRPICCTCRNGFLGETSSEEALGLATPCSGTAACHWKLLAE